MTLPLTPAPRLSKEAEPIVVPPGPPDVDLAWRQFHSGAQGERDLTERELLGHAMGSDAGLRALRQLDPREFHLPINQTVARTILELADQGRPHDAATVTRTLRDRPLAADPTQGGRGNTQLPRELDPRHIKLGRADPATVGLGAWESVRLAAPTRAPICAAEIRAHHRRDLGLAAARQAWHQYNRSLDTDRLGRVVEDSVGDVTKDLADHLVSIPRALTLPSQGGASGDLELPRPPRPGPAARDALRHRS